MQASGKPHTGNNHDLQWKRTLRTLCLPTPRAEYSHTPFPRVSSDAVASFLGGHAQCAKPSASGDTSAMGLQGTTVGPCTCTCAPRLAAVLERVASMEAQLALLQAGAGGALHRESGAASAALASPAPGAVQPVHTGAGLYLALLGAEQGSPRGSARGGMQAPAPVPGHITAQSDASSAISAGGPSALIALQPRLATLAPLSSQQLSGVRRPTTALALKPVGAWPRSPALSPQRKGALSFSSPSSVCVPFPSFPVLKTLENLLLLGKGKLPGYLGRDLESKWWSTGGTQRSKLRQIHKHILSLATTAERDLFMAPYLPTNEIDGVAFTKVYNELPAS